MRPPPPVLYTSHGVSTGFPLFNAFISFLVLVTIIVVLIRYNSYYNIIERLSHGMLGASVFLSIFKLLGFGALMLPFNDWYQLLWRMGLLFLFGGKIWRLEKHARANRAAVRQAKQHFAERAVR